MALGTHCRGCGWQANRCRPNRGAGGKPPFPRGCFCFSRDPTLVLDQPLGFGYPGFTDTDVGHGQGGPRMPKKIYVVKLTPEERSELETLVRRGKVAGWKMQRAQALLKCDQGEQGPAWIDQDIADAFGCTRQSVENWRKQAVEEGPL